MNTFIRAAEVWIPSEDRSLLELGSGWFGEAVAFGALSRQMCFGRAEGLPGRAWDDGGPVLLVRFEGSYFQRTAAAHAAGLRTAIALPIFYGARLSAVVVFFCGEGALDAGGVQIRPEASRNVGWVDRPCTGGSALRVQAAAVAGRARGLAIPCSGADGRTSILSLVSAPDLPLARRVESWIPATHGTGYARGFGFCETEGNLTASATGGAQQDLRALTCSAQEAGSAHGAEASAPGHANAANPITETFTSGSASVSTIGMDSGEPALAAASAAGARAVLTIPVVADDVVAEVVALYL